MKNRVNSNRMFIKATCIPFEEFFRSLRLCHKKCSNELDK